MTGVEDTILVVGAGTMGAGIAFVAACGGYTVELVEPDAQARERGRERIEKDAQRLDGGSAVLARLRYLDAIPEKSDATIAIEAVPEIFELKRDVFMRLAAAIDKTAILATNTSALAVSDLADVVPNPRRVLGLHFFNPPTAMKLVEIVEARDTSDDAIDRAQAFVERIGKTAAIAADTPGFIVNRVARPFYLQSMRALERGVASIEELDALARAIGFRMGPFELMDLIGLDVNLATTMSVYKRLGAERLAPVALQEQMVADGRLGRKSGAGFYEYDGVDVQRLDFSVTPTEEKNTDEYIAVLGFGGLADELVEHIGQRYARFAHIEHDELLDELDPEATIVIDVGDGTVDRGEILAQLDSLLGPETVFFVDAYATDLSECLGKLRHPERVIGYGILGSFGSQNAVEIVDTDEVSDEALELAQEFFEGIGKGVVLIEDHPGLFLGRVVGGIVNEAMIAVHENVAAPEDIDVAMRLGTNYPVGPIAWGREIGGARLSRILSRLAEAEGTQFGPHRSLWVLDVEQELPNEPVDMPMERPVL